MANMKFIYNGGVGTYNFTDNPSFYDHQIIKVKNEERSDDGSLISHRKGEYDSFVLDFDHIGTAQAAEFLTIFNTNKNIEFYPFDENRGTSLHYTVSWVNDWGFKLKDNFWASGYSGSILLELV